MDGLMKVVIMEHEGGERERMSNGWEDEGERAPWLCFVFRFLDWGLSRKKKGMGEIMCRVCDQIK